MSVLFNTILLLCNSVRVACGLASFAAANAVVAALVLPLLLVPSKALRGRAISRVLQSVCRFEVFTVLRLLGGLDVDADISKIPQSEHCGNYIVVANHISLLDPLILLALFDNLGAVLKRRYASWLVIALLVKVFDFIVVDESAKNSPRNFMDIFAEALKRRNILIFPEGGRSKSGRVGEFKKSAFKLAFDLGAEIVPVAIYSPEPMLSKSAANFFKKAHYRIEVLDTARPRDFKNPSEMRDEVCSAISAAVGCARADFRKRQAKA